MATTFKVTAKKNVTFPSVDKQTQLGRRKILISQMGIILAPHSISIPVMITLLFLKFWTAIIPYPN